MELIQGDCLDLLGDVPTGSVDAVIADLPYGITRCPWDCPIPLDRLWEQYRRVGKPNCPYILFGSGGFTATLVCSNREQWKYHWYWEKEKGTGYLNARRMPLRSIEEIAVFYAGQPTYHPQMTRLDKPRRRNLAATPSAVWGRVGSCGGELEPKTYTESYPKTLLRFPRDRGNRGVHGTQKPVALMSYLVRTYTDPGDLVLDNVMGSGTTGVACRAEGRRFLGMELDPDIFEVARQRILGSPM